MRMWLKRLLHAALDMRLGWLIDLSRLSVVGVVSSRRRGWELGGWFGELLGFFGLEGAIDAAHMAVSVEVGEGVQAPSAPNQTGPGGAGHAGLRQIMLISS